MLQKVREKNIDTGRKEGSEGGDRENGRLMRYEK